RGLREAAGRAAADHHAAELPRRQLLLDARAAAVLADGRAVQPDRLPDQRLPLELLRRRRREREGQPGDDAGVSRRLPRDRVVDVPYRLQAEEVAAVGSPLSGEISYLDNRNVL